MAIDDVKEFVQDITLAPKARNFASYMQFHMCARPWWVYIETFLPAFLKLVLFIGILDVEDLLRGHGESITREGGRRARGRKRHIPKTRQPVKETGTQRWSRRGLKTLLVVTTPLELIGFAWLVYSATDQFFQDWQTALMFSGYCEDPVESGPLQRARGPGFISIVTGFVPVIMTNNLQNRALWSTTVFKVDLPPGQYGGFFGLMLQGPIGGVSGVKIRLRYSSVFGDLSTESEPISLAFMEEGALTVRADFGFRFGFPGTLTWEIGGATIPAGIWCVRGHVTVIRRA